MGHCGATPLHRAAFSGATAAMKVLLEWNAPGSADCESRELGTEISLSDDTTRVTTPVTPLKEEFCDLLARDTR
jgi:ankyrin repeat protein